MTSTGTPTIERALSQARESVANKNERRAEEEKEDERVTNKTTASTGTPTIGRALRKARESVASMNER